MGLHCHTWAHGSQIFSACLLTPRSCRNRNQWNNTWKIPHTCSGAAQFLTIISMAKLGFLQQLVGSRIRWTVTCTYCPIPFLGSVAEPPNQGLDSFARFRINWSHDPINLLPNLSFCVAGTNCIWLDDWGFQTFSHWLSHFVVSYHLKENNCGVIVVFCRNRWSWIRAHPAPREISKVRPITRDPRFDFLFFFFHHCS